MSDTPKDGDLGTTIFGNLRRWSNGVYRRAGGGPDFVDITPTGERAAPIDWHDDVEAVAAEMRAWDTGNELVTRRVAAWADRLVPLTPKPPRWPENTVLVCGDSPHRWFVNAKGVPVDSRGYESAHPVDSDLWRVLGTFVSVEEGHGIGLDGRCETCDRDDQ